MTRFDLQVSERVGLSSRFKGRLSYYKCLSGSALSAVPCRPSTKDLENGVRLGRRGNDLV